MGGSNKSSLHFLMHSHLIATAIVLKELQIQSLKSLDDRILMQRKVYLAQLKGLPLKYGFSWHLSGPYSEDLMEDAIAIVGRDLNDVSLKPEWQHVIDLVNGLNSNNQWYRPSDWYTKICEASYKLKTDPRASKAFKNFMKA